MPEIKTMQALHEAIRSSSVVYVQIRFGCSEKWVKISKQEIKKYISDFAMNTKPSDIEMYDGSNFGILDDNTNELYLG